MAKLKTFETTVGQDIGLDMTAKIETESDLNDAKTMVDGMALYKYSPVLASMFHFTESDLNDAKTMVDGMALY